MKKKVLIIVGVILLITIICILCFYLQTVNKNNTELTMLDNILLSEEEKEIISELQLLKNSLLNPKSQDTSSNTTIQDFEMTPTESIKLSEFCKKIYGARKFINDNGETLYLFDMDTKFQDKEITRRIIVTKNGDLIYFTLTENDYDFNESENTTTEKNDGGLTISFGNEFYKAFFDQITKSIQDIWDKSLCFENVNYDTILDKI